MPSSSWPATMSWERTSRSGVAIATLGPSPYEHIMAGLGACTVITLRRYADRHGWPLGKLTVGLRHEAAPAADGFVDRFFRTIVLGGNLSNEQRRRLLDIAEECRSAGRCDGHPKS